MKGYDKNNESSCLKHWNLNNLCGWAMSQNLPVNKFEWIEDTSQFNEGFIKNYNEDSDQGYFLEIDIFFNALKSFMNFIMTYHFHQKKMKLEQNETLVADLHDKTEYIIHIRNLKQELNHGLTFCD